MDSSSALKQLQDFQGSRKNPTAYFDEAQNGLGVGAAGQQANDLRNVVRNTQTSLRGVDASVAGRTGGSLVTDAQRSRLVNLERAPIADNLNDQLTGYGDAMSNYRDLLSQAGSKASMLYQGDADKEAALRGNYEAIFGREQAAEAVRQFNEQLAMQKANAARAAAGSPFPSFGGGGGNKGEASAPKPAVGQMGTKSGNPDDGASGFWFTDSIGNPISAAQYASNNGLDIRQVLSTMALAGDSYARSALNSIPTPLASGVDANTRAKYSLLFNVNPPASSGGGGGGGGGGGFGNVQQKLTGGLPSAATRGLGQFVGGF